MGRYQKGKTNLDLTEARDGEWQWHQLGHTQVCTSFQTDASTSPQSKQAKWNQILFTSTGDMHTSACFKIVNKCWISKFAQFKFKDFKFSRIFKYFQAPYLFSSTFKGLEVFIPNSSIFNDFASTLWTLIKLLTRASCRHIVQTVQPAAPCRGGHDQASPACIHTADRRPSQRHRTQETAAVSSMMPKTNIPHN